MQILWIYSVLLLISVFIGINANNNFIENKKVCKQFRKDNIPDNELNSCKTPQKSNDSLLFCPPMIESKPLLEEKYGEIPCCIFNTDLILWYFRHLNDDEYFPVNPNRNVIFLNENRTLAIKGVDYRIKNGFYRCIGFKNDLNISMETRVIIAKSKNKLNLQILNSSEPFTKPHTIGSTFTVFCSCLSYKLWMVNVYWFKIENGVNYTNIQTKKKLNLFNKSSKLINNYNGYTKLKIMEINESLFNKLISVLQIENVQSNQVGVYQCVFKQKNHDVSVKFKLDITLKNFELIYSLIGIFCIILTIIGLGYIFIYDIRLLSKSLFRVYISKKDRVVIKYNFLFIYDFDSETEYFQIYPIVESLYYRGYTSYFYHRDKTYGKDLLDDLNCAIIQSEVVVLWINNKFWNNSLIRFCIQILINKYTNLQRLYIINQHKRKVKKHFQSKIIASDMSNNLFSKTFHLMHNHHKCIKKLQRQLSLNDTVAVKSSKSIQQWDNATLNVLEKWKLHNFITWLISSRPIHCPHYYKQAIHINPQTGL